VAEFLFKGIHPQPDEYINICSEAFGTPFFAALKGLSETEGLAPPFLSKTMDISLIDAKALYGELA
jgi:hypothetical protein